MLVTEKWNHKTYLGYFTSSSPNSPSVRDNSMTHKINFYNLQIAHHIQIFESQFFWLGLIANCLLMSSVFKEVFISSLKFSGIELLYVWILPDVVKSIKYFVLFCRTPGSGLYDNLQQYKIPYPEAIFDLMYFYNNPKPFFTLAKELYPGKFRPNYVHYFVRMLHEKGKLLRMYTQNIDGLERCKSHFSYIFL